MESRVKAKQLSGWSSTRLGKVCYPRKKHYMTWRDVANMVQFVDENTDFPPLSVFTSSDFFRREYYSVIEAWIVLSSIVGNLELDNPAYVELYYRALQETTKSGDRERKRFARVGIFLEEAWREIIFKIIKDYVGLFKMILSKTGGLK